MNTYRLLTAARAIDDHRVSVTFDDGTTGVLDCRPYFSMGYYRPLKNPSFFRCAHVSYGALAWPNDIDIGADDVWDEAEKTK